jgi:hypothetical protein
MNEPRKHLAGIASGLDICYDLGEGHRCSEAGWERTRSTDLPKR